MDDIQNILLVGSGKGGVGKSTVSANLALALSHQGFKVGLLDADIYGPSLPTMFGDAPKPGSPDGKRIYPIEKAGIRLISMGYLVDPNVAMVWRGPMLAGAVTQFITDVDWGPLDYLIVDLPPGTGDIQLTLAQKFKIAGAILVTTPQAVALADVYRAKAMFDKVRIEIVGLIENMSYFVCNQCSAQHPIFDTGGGERASQELQVPFLGQIPLEPAVRVAGDAGLPIVAQAPESATSLAFDKVAQAVHASVEQFNQRTAKVESRKRALRIIKN